MRQTRRDLDLAEEPLGTHARRELRAEHLERDGAVVLKIAGEVDRRHPAAAKLALDRVTAREGDPQSCRRIRGHR